MPIVFSKIWYGICRIFLGWYRKCLIIKPPCTTVTFNHDHIIILMQYWCQQPVMSSQPGYVSIHNWKPKLCWRSPMATLDLCTDHKVLVITKTEETSHIITLLPSAHLGHRVLLCPAPSVRSSIHRYIRPSAHPSVCPSVPLSHPHYHSTTHNI